MNLQDAYYRYNFLKKSFNECSKILLEDQKIDSDKAIFSFDDKKFRIRVTSSRSNFANIERKFKDYMSNI